MKIKLHEIHEEGKRFILNRNTGELNEALADLVGQAPYEAEVFIVPINSKNYSVKGYIKSSTLELCSVCGEEFQFPSEARVNEILIPGKVDGKNDHSSKSNHVSELNDDGPSVVEFFNDHFDLGEYLHEALALTIPFNPKHDAQDKNCLKPLNSQDETVFIYDEKMGEEKKNNPFEALKGIKLS